MQPEAARPDDQAQIARRALTLLDLTNLNDDCAESDVEALCKAAVTAQGKVAAVCIWPRFVAYAAGKLKGSGVRVATVANFPSGAGAVDEAAAETAKAFADGADEVDVVIPWRALLKGDELASARLLKACRQAAPKGKTLKAILETGELKNQKRIEDAARIALAAGVDFLKTSTGKRRVSATPKAAEILLTALQRRRKPFGFKASGGVRTTEQAAEYLAIADRIMGPDWATPETFRFGASSLLDDLLKTIEGGAAKPAKKPARKPARKASSKGSKGAS